MKTVAEPTWTKPYYGVQHTPRARYWCSVNDHKSFAELVMWFDGYSPNNEHSHHETAAQARAAGEAWLAQMRDRAR